MSKAEKRKKARERNKYLYTNSPAYRNRQKDLKLRKAYGITLEDYEKLSLNQDDKCLICDKNCPSGKRLAVDHCHDSNIVRGLLCINCNKGIGNFKNSVELLDRAITYLNAFKTAVEEYNAVNKKSIEQSISA